MEFTTRTSERDYVAAFRLRLRTLLIVFNALFIFLLVSFYVLFAFAFDYGVGSPWDYLLPFILLMCLLGFRMYLPHLMGRIYGARTNQQGESVNELTSNGVSKKSTEGSLLYFPWTVCKNWRESQRVVIVIAEFGICLVYPKACLSTGQQDELRGILTAALPKK
jgi:hypothetical protein